MEKKQYFFLAVRFHGNGGHLGFYGTHQDTYNFRTAISNVVKGCTHRRHVNEEMYTTVFCLVEYYILNIFFFLNTKFTDVYHFEITPNHCICDNDFKVVVLLRDRRFTRLVAPPPSRS